MQELAAELDAAGTAARVYCADLADAAARERLAVELDANGVSVDVLVNHATRLMPRSVSARVAGWLMRN